MTNRQATVSTTTTYGPFEKGQVWRIGDLNLAITSVGKSLVHYKRYKTQPKGVRTTLSSQSELQGYLRDARAVLVSE